MKLLLLAVFQVSFVHAAPLALFDGETLAHWEIPAGEEKWWKVQDGMIVGGSLDEKIPKNLFLASSREFRNFDLKFKIRMLAGEGFMNSGIQVRSRLSSQDLSMIGYQVDVGIGYWGDLYDEHRRNKRLTGAQDPAALATVVKDWDWNEYRILCEGRRIRSWINGCLSFDYTESDSSIPLDGRLGIQVHSGGSLLVQVKDCVLEELPDTPGAPSWEPTPPARPVPKAEGSNARTPEEERQSFRLPEGFVAELVASEEQGVGKPITMAWDGRGRLWTMSALEYPVDANENRESAEALYARGGVDRLLVFDQAASDGPRIPSVFAEGLALPLGILPDLDGNGALVQYGSQIRRYVDTDRDGKADKFDVILDGFGIQDSHLMPHQFERAPGGWIYVAQGLFNSSKVRRPNGLAFADGSKEKLFSACKLARFRPDGSDFEIVTAGPNNIWGLFQTRFGETFLQEANDMGIPVTEFEPGVHYGTGSKDKLRAYAPQIPLSLTTGLGGSGLSGLALAEDRDCAFAKLYGGDQVIYVANPITSRIQVITSDAAEDQHPQFFKREDFLVSEDPWFRPVAIHFGPDGYLYIADWYNKVISHNEVPRAHPDRDKTRGRIWRIRPVGSTPPLLVDFTRMSKLEVINRLGGLSARTAAMAWAWLAERMDSEIEEVLAGIAMDSQLAVPRRLDAFRALEAARIIDAKVFQELAADPSPAIRYQALRAAGELQIDAELWVKLFRDMPDDANYRVRAALANSARSHRTPNSEMLAVVAKLGRTPLQNRGVWETYDRDFERYLARWAMETHRDETLRMLKLDRSLDQESRLLAILSLDSASAATLLVSELATLTRALAPEELSLLGSQLSQAPVMAAFQALLKDEARRMTALVNLTLLDSKMLANPKLATAVATACEDILAKKPSVDERVLILKLARLLRLSSLEPAIAGWMKDETPAGEVVEILSTLREIDSERIELFVGYLRHPDQAVRREAMAALAFCDDLASLDFLSDVWVGLPAAMRVTVVDGLTSSTVKAAAFAKAALDGKFKGLDSTAFEKLHAVLGVNDASLATLLKQTDGMLERVIRVRGSGDAMEKQFDLVGPFTLETWILLESEIDNGDGLIGRRGGADINFYEGRLHIYGGDGVGDMAVGNQTMRPDVWTHCAVTRDEKGNFRIYINGELDHEDGRQFNVPMRGLRLGATNSGKPGAACYDEFRIWSVARSAEEIRNHFRTRYGDEIPANLQTRFSGDHGGPWSGPASVEWTHDFPQLVSPEQAEAAQQRFARLYKLAEGEGDPTAGRVLFQASCMMCHQVQGNGAQIGPDLSGMGAMGVQGILRNILDPNAQLESGYYRHDVTSIDGVLVSGFMVEETKDSITIRPIGGDPKVIPRETIATHSISKRSLMPEGLIDAYDQKQVADLFAYMKSLQ
jgi:putative heme-binding domain-containing protein